MTKDNTYIHITTCCLKHGCTMSADKFCPILTRSEKAKSSCELCKEEEKAISVIKEEILKASTIEELEKILEEKKKNVNEDKSSI